MNRLEVVKISNVKEHPEIVHRASTFYKWHHKGEHLDLFMRFPGSNGLFLDLNAYRSKFQRRGE